MSRFLTLTLTLSMALGLVACDEATGVNGENRINAFGWDGAAAVDMNDAGAPPNGPDASWGGYDASLGSDASATNDPDGGMGVTNTDAGTGTDAGATTSVTTCNPAECGNPPTTTPLCFNGLQAASSCERWVDGTCRWQLVCGP